MDVNEQARRFKEESYRARQYRLKHGSNRFLYTFLIVFVLGYAVFFTSRLWLPVTYVGVDVTPIGEVVTENEREIIIDSWSYARKEHAMEILLEIRSLAVDGIEDYSFRVKTKDGNHPVKQILRSDDLFVLHVSRVPEEWTEASLTIKSEGKEGEQVANFDPVVLYTNDRTAREVGHIGERSLAEYQCLAITQKIGGYRKTIVKLRKANRDIDHSIAEAEMKIAKIKGEMGYQTPGEAEDSMDALDSLERKKMELKDDRKENEKEIEEYEDKISLQEQKQMELKGVPTGKGRTGAADNNGGSQK